ncbi:MAG: sigma 54-interacting transcriptional regulator [Thermodesulfobacteriota bacterium]|nr:sigma 54-interacting transcriptional regulator [Thermodesulfobacteriota bacterium]
MPQLIVSQNGSNYRVVTFKHALSIGRDADNELVLDSLQVSRHHGTVQKKDDNFYLSDCGSTNAIWLGNEKITSILLVNGLTFRIVDFFFTFVEEQQDTPARVFSEKEEQDARQDDDLLENKTILFGLDSFLPGDTKDETPGNELADTHYSDLLNSFQLLVKADTESELFSLLLRSSLRLAGGHCGFIATRDAEDELVYRTTENMAPDTKKSLRNDLINRAMTTEATVLSNMTLDYIGSSGTRRNQLSQPAFCSPLFFEGHVEGCLYIEGSDQKPAAQQYPRQIELLLCYGSALLERLRYRVRISLEKQGLKNRLATTDETIIQSESMVRLYEDIKTIAPINVPVLILGEPGTGKELVASALHSFSKRQGGFVTLNCSAIPEGIFESELFGSVKGAFHNAVDKPGKLEMAHNGTLFLDEIGDMDLALQPKLLRFLENREITRLGDIRVKKLDVRIVAATNQDLDTMMQENKFREDFFQRLSCFVLNVPPLRERKEDIAPLINHFLKRFAHEYSWAVPGMSEPVLNALIHYAWPGNIRELRNTILRLSVQARGKNITTGDLARISDSIGQETHQQLVSFPSMEEMEKKYISKALDRAGWNISDAAKMIGIARSTFYQKMKKFQITAAKK